MFGWKIAKKLLGRTTWAWIGASYFWRENEIVFGAKLYFGWHFFVVAA